MRHRVRDRANTLLLTALSAVIAVLLVAGGFLLGMDPGIGGVARGYVRGWGASSLSAKDLELQREVFSKLEDSYYKEIDPEIARIAALDAMVAALGDPYTFYMDPEEYASLMEKTSGSYSGVGMTVQMSGHLVTVISLFEGSPAEAAGLEDGDVIIAVDGKPTTGQTLEEVVSGIKGREGTTVVLTMYRPAPVASTTTTTEPAETEDDTTVATLPTADLSELPPGGTTTEYTLTRTEIAIPATESEMLSASGKKVAHISLYSFSETAAASLRAEVERAVDEDRVAAIILDLRGNPGGLLGSAIDVSSIFIENGVIVSTEGLHSPERLFEARGGAFADVPLYVLTDEYSASASEIVSGALQDYDRATIIGETTYGKGLVQTIVGLSDGGALKMTTAVYLTPSGRDINQLGIVPDVVVPDDPLTEEVDETVDAALDLIAGSSTAP